MSKLGRITICYLEWKLPYLLRVTLRYMCIQGRGEGTHLKSSDRCTIKAQSVSFLQNSINTPILEGPAPRVDCRLLIIRKKVDRQFWQRPERKISKAGGLRTCGCPEDGVDGSLQRFARALSPYVVVHSAMLG